MSSKLVRGKDVILFVVESATDYPIICAKSCSATRTFAEIEITSWASDETEWNLGMSTTEITLDGIVTVQPINAGDKTVFDFFAGGTHDIKMVFTDLSGATKTLTCAAVVPTVSLTGDVAAFASFSLRMKASGTVTIV